MKQFLLCILILALLTPAIGAPVQPFTGKLYNKSFIVYSGSTPIFSVDYATGNVTITGTLSGLSVSLASLSDWPAAVSATEVDYLDGVTSDIQTQLNGKLPLSGGTLTGNVTMDADDKITWGTDGGGYERYISGAIMSLGQFGEIYSGDIIRGGRLSSHNVTGMNRSVFGYYDPDLLIYTFDGLGGDITLTASAAGEDSTSPGTYRAAGSVSIAGGDGDTTNPDGGAVTIAGGRAAEGGTTGAVIFPTGISVTGSATFGDSNLYEATSNILTTDDNLDVKQTLYVRGNSNLGDDSSDITLITGDLGTTNEDGDIHLYDGQTLDTVRPSTHNHSGTAGNGANIPESSVTNLVTDLGLKARSTLPTQISYKARNIGGQLTTMALPGALGYTSGWSVQAMFDCTDLRVCYGNWDWDAAAGMIPSPNAITVKASVLYNGVRYPLFFNGQRSYTIDPGGIVRTDPLPISITQGATVKILTYVSVEDGEKIPACANNFAVGASNPETYDLGNDTTDSGDIDTTQRWIAMYIPLAVEGTPLDSTPRTVIGCLGDSIGVILFDDQYQVPGIITDYPVICQTKGSDRAYWYTGRTNRHEALRNCTSIICELGTNDKSQTIAATKANLQKIWDQWAARGMAVYQTTIPPISTSTDGWTTVENQVPDANKTWRDTVNDWIRTLPSPLTGVIDISDAVSTSRNSGIWKVDGGAWTADGIHPKNEAAGAARMAIKALTDAVSWQ